MKPNKVFNRLLSGSKNIAFSDLVSCAEDFGFTLNRIKGSHHIFTHEQIPELLNLQNAHGKAKPYQVKQFLQYVERYNLQPSGSK